MPKLPNYTLVRNGTFYVRIPVPKALRTRLKRLEIKHSLRTKDSPIAHKRANIAIQLIFALFETVKNSRELSVSDIDKLLKGMMIKVVSASMPGLDIKLDLPDHPQIEKEFAKDLVDSNALKQVEEYRQKYSELLAQGQGLSVTTKEDLSVSNDTPTPPVQLLSELFDEYTQERLRTKEWKSHTADGYREAFELYVTINGDLDINEISSTHHNKYRSTLQKLPANRSKRPQYRDMSVEDLMTMDVPESDRLQVRTVEHHITRANAFFNWIRAMGIRSDIPTVNRLRKKNGAKSVLPHEERENFTNDQLKVLFNSKRYRDHSYLHAFQFWIPLIALHTGCRLKELCQLEPQDIECIDGVWCIYVNQVSEMESRFGIQKLTQMRLETHQKSIKAAASQRHIPIHKALIRLGFLNFVKSRSGSPLIFSELHASKDGTLIRQPSRWFQKLRGNLDLKGKSGMLDFHSFRHTFIDDLQYHAPTSSQKYLAGHANSDITTGRYSKPGNVDKLKEYVDSIDYSSVISHLKPWSEARITKK